MNFIKDFLTKDIWRKLIALTIACVLFFNLYEYKERDVHDVKVEIINGDPDIFIDPVYKNIPVRLKVKGTKQNLEKVTLLNDITGNIKLDVDFIRDGKARLRLQPQNFVTPRGVKIVGIEPEIIEIPIQRKKNRELKIIPKITGKPAPGKVMSVSAIPDMVTVSGPEQVVNSLPDYIDTEEFTPGNDDISFSIPLDLINPNPETLQLNISKTKVKIDIQDSYDITRDISVAVKYLHSTLRSNEHPVQLPVPNKVSVKVKGNQSDISQLTRNDITVFADLENITTPGEHSVPLKAVLTKPGTSVQVVSITPATVKITIKEVKK